MTIVGGVGTLFGSFVGAAAIITLENIVSSHTERWQTVLGLTFILIMILAPEGIVGKARVLIERVRRSKSRPPIPNPHGRIATWIDGSFSNLPRGRRARRVSAPLPGRRRWRRKAPIKVGLLAPLTGVVASGGREMVEGTQFFFESIGNRSPAARSNSSSRTMPPIRTPPCRRRAVSSSRPT